LLDNYIGEVLSVEVPDYDEFNDLEVRVDDLESATSGLDDLETQVEGLVNDLETLGQAHDGLVDTVGQIGDTASGTATAVGTLGTKVADLEDELARVSSTVVGPKVYHPEDYFVAGDTDWTPAFQKMFDDIDSTLRTDPAGSVPLARGSVLLDSRSYNVSGTILRPKTGRASGLTVRGVGKRASEIVLSGSGNLLENRDRWMNVNFEHMSFRGTGGGNALYSHSSTAGANQDWNFERVEWRGSWGNGIVLDGPNPNSNMNSEWAFNRCTVTGSYADAWYNCGATPEVAQQDQFLNHWFWGCKFEWSGGTMFKMNRGGAVDIQGASIIMTGTNQRFWYAPVASPGHADSVQHVALRGCRIEPRDVSNVIWDSAWRGTQYFESVEDNAWAYRSGNDDVVLWKFRNPSRVKFSDCTFGGRAEFIQDTAPSQQSIRYEGTARTEATHRDATYWVKSGSQAAAVKIRVTADAHIADIVL
jgi:hypothetical protein